MNALRRRIRRALEATEGNPERAFEALGQELVAEYRSGARQWPVLMLDEFPQELLRRVQRARPAPRLNRIVATARMIHPADVSRAMAAGIERLDPRENPATARRVSQEITAITLRCVTELMLDELEKWKTRRRHRR